MTPSHDEISSKSVPAGGGRRASLSVMRPAPTSTAFPGGCCMRWLALYALFAAELALLVRASSVKIFAIRACARSRHFLGPLFQRRHSSMAADKPVVLTVEALSFPAPVRQSCCFFDSSAPVWTHPIRSLVDFCSASTRRVHIWIPLSVLGNSDLSNCVSILLVVFLCASCSADARSVLILRLSQG